ncbi:MAG: hypothetical protein AAFQ04_00335 [Pseudomonadota bacterium]
MQTVKRIDTGLLVAIVVILILTVAISFISSEFFTKTYAAEDGIVEYATAVFLLIASFILIRNSASLKRRGLRLAFGLTLFYALLFFLASGEEISWGQRIFGWETSEAMKARNKQDETNFHNLVLQTPFGELDLVKTVFGSVLTTVLLIYLVVFPLLFPKSERFAHLANRFAIPVPRRSHAVLAIVSSLVITVIEPGRKWEVYELIFSLLATSIFLMPQNKEHTQ